MVSTQQDGGASIGTTLPTRTIVLDEAASQSLPSLEQLQQQHYKLMEEYSNVANHASRLPSFFIPAQGDVEASDTLRKGELHQSSGALGIIVKLFAESHIRARLKELSAAYTQLLACIEPSGGTPTGYEEWLVKSKKQCDDFADSFSSWPKLRVILSALGPVPLVVVGFQILGSSLPNLCQGCDPWVVVTFVGLVLAQALYVLIPLNRSFRYKRNLFLPGAAMFERKRSSGITTTRGRNVYKAEDSLFDLLERGKGREIPIDIIAMGAWVAMTAYAVLLVIVPTLSAVSVLSNSVTTVIGSLAATPVILIHSVFGAKAKRRTWR